MNDYVFYQNRNDRCPNHFSDKENIKFINNLYEKFRLCKKLSFSDVTCLTDDDCYSDVTMKNYSCGVVTNKCEIPWEIREISFVSCVVESMDKSQQIYAR